MNRFFKLHVQSAFYCGVLISLNWYRTTHYARGDGVTSESILPVALALLLSVAIVVALAWRIAKRARWRLEGGERVRPGRWIESWSVAIYALPLLWQHITTASWKEPDGALATSVGGYGHALSSWIFLFAIGGLLLAQIGNRLSER